MKLIKASAVLTTLLLTSTFAEGAPENRAIGDSRVISEVPAPGFPEGIAVAGNRFYVTGPAVFGHFGISKLFEYDKRDGTLLRDWIILGQDPNVQHGISCVALDAKNRAYVLDTSQGIVRIDTSKSPDDPSYQDLYATMFPDLPPCLLVTPGTACSPTVANAPPLPNDIAFDALGFAYVTDSLQATIWRVPPGAGNMNPEIWFQDAKLDRAFGPNGLRVSPDGNWIYFVVSASPGQLYRLPRTDHPSADLLEMIHFYPVEVPDGLTFSASGDIYVALAGTNQISVLGPSGNEKVRYNGPARKRDGGFVPWDMPANIAFDNPGERILVTNHAEVYGEIASDHFVVFDIYVNDKGTALFKPALP
jgi:sugar lactone lactonase YvrE